MTRLLGRAGDRASYMDNFAYLPGIDQNVAVIDGHGITRLEGAVACAVDHELLLAQAHLKLPAVEPEPSIFFRNERAGALFQRVAATAGKGYLMSPAIGHDSLEARLAAGESSAK